MRAFIGLLQCDSRWSRQDAQQLALLVAERVVGRVGGLHDLCDLECAEGLACTFDEIAFQSASFLMRTFSFSDSTITLMS